MSIKLPSRPIDAGELLQHVSRIAYRDSPLYCGRDGADHYDDPTRDYGVLYLEPRPSHRVGISQAPVGRGITSPRIPLP